MQCSVATAPVWFVPIMGICLPSAPRLYRRRTPNMGSAHRRPRGGYPRGTPPCSVATAFNRGVRRARYLCRGRDGDSSPSKGQRSFRGYVRCRDGLPFATLAIAGPADKPPVTIGADAISTGDAAAMDDAERTWHATFAKQLFNHSWDLLERPDRTDRQDHEMLHAAFASRYHWGVVGTEANWVVGDGQIARIASALGHQALALHYATRALDTACAQGWRDFRLASSYETMARAHSAAGNAAERDRYLALARDALDLIDDPEDRRIIEEQIDTVPLGA